MSFPAHNLGLHSFYWGIGRSNRLMIPTADRVLRQSDGRMHRTFQVIVAGEELTVGTGDLVHLARSSDRVSHSHPSAPGQQ